MMIPAAPASRTLRIVAGVASGTLTTDEAPPASMAVIMRTADSMPKEPCSMSTITKSSPLRAWSSLISGQFIWVQLP